MNTHGPLEDLISEIGARAGLPLQLDEFGSCAIQYDDISEVALTSCDSGKTILLHCPLAFLCDQRPLEHLQHCLEISIYGAETDGGAVGLDPESRSIIFWRRMGLDGLDSHTLEHAIVTFIKATERCRTLLINRHAGLDQQLNEAPVKAHTEDSRVSEQSFTTHATLMRI